MKRYAKLKVGESYKNKNGGKYRCLHSYSNGNAKLINIDSGWCFEAHCIILYDDDTIEWDYSTGGKFVSYE